MFENLTIWSLRVQIKNLEVEKFKNLNCIEFFETWKFAIS